MIAANPLHLLYPPPFLSLSLHFFLSFLSGIALISKLSDLVSANLQDCIERFQLGFAWNLEIFLENQERKSQRPLIPSNLSDIRLEMGDSASIGLTGRTMLVGTILLFFVMFIALFLHLYAKWFWYRREEEAATYTTRRRRRFDFAPSYLESASAPGLRRGLDPSVLKSLPVVIFNPKDFKNGLECAVCLSELADGEKARLLPRCNHGFHVDCIDMWFQSHSTCPLCRNWVSTQSSSAPELTLEALLQSPRAENSAVGVYSTESTNFPTNVLFWGNQTQVSTLGSCLEEDRQGPTSSRSPSSSSSSSSLSSSSSSSATGSRPEGMLVIDIPRQISEDDEPKSPVTMRLRSLKRLLSRDRRVNPCSPGVNAEQAGRGQS